MKTKGKLRGWLRVQTTRALIVGAVFASAVGVDFLRLGSELPPLGAGDSQRVLDRYGQEIRHALSVNGERRYVFPLDEVPEQLRELFVESEDRRFFSHRGVDARALARGVLQSLRQHRKVSGGSTITVQLVRTEWPQLRGWIHKPAQLLQALRIERRYGKGEILSRYLNTVPFGRQISGVGAACRYYFDRTCAQLSVAQMAALAVLPRNPELFLKKPAALTVRRNALLERALAGAEPLVREQALAEPIVFARASLAFYAPQFAERALDEKKHEMEIRTTLDLELQKSVQELLRAETLKRRGTGDSGAALVIENATGHVLAYVGSPDYFDEAHGMVDGIRARRSPGSALKPFVYELALENGWNLFDLVPDIPMVFSTQRAVYEPHNYGGNFSGPRTIREALGNSKNLPALYMVSRLGESPVLERLRAFGLSTLDQDAAFYGVGLALGNGEVTLWDLTQAYATLARGGVSRPATFYRGEEGRIRRVAPEETAYLIADVLRDAEARQEEFGRFGPLEFDYAVAVKTGTSSDYRDHWTVGFTRQITVGVWRGNADATPLEQRVSASRSVGPLFHRIMDLAHRYREPAWLARPGGVESSRVCAYSGQRPGPHCLLTRFELHLKGQGPRQLCDFHRRVTVPDCQGHAESVVYLQLPKEYDEWARNSRLPTLENQLREKCGESHRMKLAQERGAGVPWIAEPLDRSAYAIDPTVPVEHQEIRFLLRDADGVRVYVNDEPVAAEIENGGFFWPLKRGQYKFQLRKGTVASNAVQISVR